MHTISTLHSKSERVKNEKLKVNFSLFTFHFLLLVLLLGFQNNLSAQTCPVSNEISISVYPQPDISITGAATICASGTATLTATTSGGVPGTCTVQWESSLDGSTGWTPVTNTNSNPNIFNTPLLTVSTYYHAVIACTGTGCTGKTSNSQLITVVPAIAITVQPVGFDECLTGTQSLSVQTSGGTGAGTLNYQWFYGVDSITMNPVSGATASTYTPLSSSTGTTFYKVVVSSAVSGCGSKTSYVAKVTVTPQLALATDILDITECVGGNDSLSVATSGGAGTKTYIWESSTTGVNGSFNPIGGAPNSPNYKPTSYVAGTTYYHVRVQTSGNGCNEISSRAAKVVVNPVLTLTNTLNPFEECTNGNQSLTINTSGGIAPLTYQWQSSPNGSTGWAAIATGGTNATYTPVSTTAGTTYYRVLVTSGGTACGNQTSNVVKIVVSPQISIVKDLINITECVGGTDNLSFVITGGASDSTFIWESSPNGSTAWAAVGGAPNASTYQPVSTTAGTFYYRVRVISALNNCTTVTSTTATVTINPVLTITNTLNPFEECVGGNQSLTINTSGGISPLTYQWQSSPNNLTWSNVASGGTGATYIPVSTTSGTTYYRVQVTSAGAACGSQTSNAVKVVVSPQITVVKDITNITECVGGTDKLSFVITGGASDSTFIWESSTASSSGPFTVIAGAPNASTYQPVSTTAGTTYYRVRVTSALNNCTSVTSATAMVIVNPILAITNTLNPFEECTGGNQSLTINTSGGISPLTYQWQSSADGSTNWTAVASNGTSATYTPVSTTAGTTYYRVLVTSGGTACGNQTSNVVKIVVSPQISIVKDLNNITECVDGTDKLSFVITGGASDSTFIWESSATGIASSFTAVAGAPNASTYTPVSTTAGTTYYRVRVTSALNNCTSVTSATATVIVNPVLTITNTLADFSECTNGTQSFTVNVTGGVSGQITYTWLQSASASGPFTPASGSNNGPTYTPNATTAGVTYYKVLVTSGGTNCGNPNSNVATVTVTPQISITAQPQPIVECTNGAKVLSVTATGGSGTLHYQWLLSSSLTGPYSAISNTDNNDYTPNSVSDGITFYKVVVSASGNGCGLDTSVAIKVDVRKQLVITADLIGFIECKDGTQSLQVVVANGTGTANITYQWFSSTTSNGGFNTITGAISPTYTPPSGTVGTLYYNVIITDNGGGCDPITSKTVAVTVNPQLSILAQPQDLNECTQGNQSLSVTISNGAGIVSYQWQSSTSNNLASFTNISGEVLNTYTPTNTAAGTTYYRVIVNAAGTGCDSIVSRIATVVVAPQISLVTPPSPIDECIGGTDVLTVVILGGSGSAHYEWQISPDNVAFTSIGNSDNQTYQPSSTTAGTTYYRVIITNTDKGCNQDTITGTRVTVFDKPTLTTTASVTAVCVNGAVQLNAIKTGGAGSCIIKWQVINVGGTYDDIVPSASGNTYVTPPLTKDVKYRAQITCSGSGCCN